MARFPCKFKAVPVAIQLCNPARTLVSVGNVNGKVLFKKVGLSTNLLGWISFQLTMTLKFYLFNAILNTTTVFQATTSCVFPTATKNSSIG